MLRATKRPLSATTPHTAPSALRLGANVEVLKKHEEWKTTGTVEIPVFYPTMEDMEDFSAYIAKLEEKDAHEAGICKIIPPKEWFPRPTPANAASPYEDVIRQCIHRPRVETIRKEKGSKEGVYVMDSELYEYEQLPVGGKGGFEERIVRRIRRPTELSLRELEAHYWTDITNGHPLYGSDSVGSFFNERVHRFNLNNLGTLVDRLKTQIPGLNSSFLYFGSYKSTFPWHSEDMNLYSVSYLHYGAPKFWYAVPPSKADDFEKMAQKLFPSLAAECKAFIQHKNFVISPEVLRSHNVPYGTMVQWPGEFIVTFPRGYHMGYNVDYNCAEAVNFALDRWIPYGKMAPECCCVDRPNAVKRHHISALFKKVKLSASRCRSQQPGSSSAAAATSSAMEEDVVGDLTSSRDGLEEGELEGEGDYHHYQQPHDVPPCKIPALLSYYISPPEILPKNQPLRKPAFDHHLHVSNLNTITTQAIMQRHFSQFGKLVHCKLILGGPNGAKFSKCYGFVAYSTKEEMDRALMASHMLDGNLLKVEKKY